MAYDKKTGTINIGAKDSQKDFERDLFAHFAHIEQEVAKELQAKKPVVQPKKIGFKDRLHNLSKPVKASIVFMVVWTLFVIYRTADYHEVLGIDLDRWDDDNFLTNWLGVPVVVYAIYWAIRWVVKDKQSKQPVQKVKINPLTEFEKELNTWPADQAKVALLLIKATLTGNQKAIDSLYGELTFEQLKKVKAVLEQMENN